MLETPPDEFRFIAEQAALEALCSTLGTATWLALDTEFERSRSFYAELCLVQIAAPGVLVCIDPFAVESLVPLMSVLASGTAPKLAHAARQDLEVLYGIDSRLPAPLFDTQLAAGLAGYADNIGYADLVQQLLGVTIDKSQTRTDWRQRPLTAAQLDYAAADVLHLAPIMELLAEKLASLGRSAWLAEDCQALLSSDSYRQSPHTAWQRLRGLQSLPVSAQARAIGLAAWRESTAQSRNLPRGWVLKDEELMALASAVPTTLSALSVLCPNNGSVRRHGDAILEILRAPPAVVDPPLTTRRLSAAGRTLLKQLAARAQDIAQQLGLASTLLITRRELEALIAGEPVPRVRDGWRGSVLVELLAMRPDPADSSLWES